MTKRNEHGSTLMEIVVVAALLSVVSLAFLGTFASISRFHEKNTLSIKGDLLAEEGVEALRLFKSTGWAALSALPAGEDRYFQLSLSSWGVTTTPEVIDGDFYRSFRIYPVARDVSDDIVSSGGTLDPDTLLMDVSVRWAWRTASSSANYKAYMTNI